MIAAMQKENFKEEKMTEKFSIISNRISDYRLKPRDYAVYCCLVKHSDKNGVCFPSRRLIAEQADNRVKHPTEPHKGEIRRCNRRVRPFFFSAVKMKVLHKSAVVFEEVRLIPQKSTAVRK